MSEALRNIGVSFHAPAMSKEQERTYNKTRNDNEYGNTLTNDIPLFEDTMKWLFISGVSCEAMIQAIERFAHDREMWDIVVKHETECKKELT